MKFNQITSQWSGKLMGVENNLEWMSKASVTKIGWS